MTGKERQLHRLEQTVMFGIRYGHGAFTEEDDMRCELCGSKKDVRFFRGYALSDGYTECRRCFERIMKVAKRVGDLPEDEEFFEQEWNRGMTEKPGSGK